MHYCVFHVIPGSGKLRQLEAQTLTNFCLSLMARVSSRTGMSCYTLLCISCHSRLGQAKAIGGTNVIYLYLSLMARVSSSTGLSCCTLLCTSCHPWLGQAKAIGGTSIHGSPYECKI